ncbi:ABC transporter substrate-binding protein [Glutamicibacter sp.]|uniref:ABC transporter substrate-binding protein n=1 Tax=Glutamicibacter sp. TaxID=1931995 RepID=UPI0028BD353A|nr:ABC transporter substrate-binding protein [Glutamicibacter sp.]
MMNKKYRWVVSVAGLTMVATLGLTSCANGTEGANSNAGQNLNVPFGPSSPKAEGPLETVSWMLPGEPTTLDADIDATTPDDMILANTCDRLMQVQPDLSLGKGIASSAEWTDKTHLELTIRQDATFHDGSKVSTADVLWSLKRHAADGAAESDEYQNVVSIDQTADDQITVTTTQPDAIFLQAMAGDGGIVWNPRVIESEGEKFGSPNSESACGGPFKVEDWVPGQHLTLVRNDDYWQKDRVAKTERVVLRWADEAAAINSLTAGEVQGAYFENPGAARPFISNASNLVFQGPSTNAWVGEVTPKGALTDVRLRQALSLAIDREGIAKAAFGGLAMPWKTPVGSGAWGYEPETFKAAYDELEGAPAKPSDADIEKAKALVSEAGIPEGPLVIASNGSSVHNVIAGALTDAAKKIGIETEILAVPEVQYGDFYNDEQLRNSADIWPDVYYISKADPLGFYKNGRSDSARNFVGYSDPEYDKIVDEAYASTDDAERAKKTIELEKKWVGNAIWLPLVATPSTLVMSNQITGAPSSAAYIYYPWAADLGSTKG